MINVVKAPDWRVHWYVSDWRTNKVYVVNTKSDAMGIAKEVYQGDENHVVNVDWLPFGSDPRITVSKTSDIIDKRHYPHRR